LTFPRTVTVSLDTFYAASVPLYTYIYFT